MEYEQISRWRKVGIGAVAGLAGLVGSAALGGCANNCKNLVVNPSQNSLRINVQDPNLDFNGGIDYFRILSEEGEVIFDSRKNTKYSDLNLTKKLEIYLDKGKLREKEKYSLELLDKAGSKYSFPSYQKDNEYHLNFLNHCKL